MADEVGVKVSEQAPGSHADESDSAGTTEDMAGDLPVYDNVGDGRNYAAQVSDTSNAYGCTDADVCTQKPSDAPTVPAAVRFWCTCTGESADKDESRGVPDSCTQTESVECNVAASDEPIGYAPKFPRKTGSRWMPAWSDALCDDADILLSGGVGGPKYCTGPVCVSSAVKENSEALLVGLSATGDSAPSNRSEDEARTDVSA